MTFSCFAATINGIIDVSDGDVVSEPEVSIHHMQTLEHLPGLICAASFFAVSSYFIFRDIQNSMDCQ